jgi:hypothetical protein
MAGVEEDEEEAEGETGASLYADRSGIEERIAACSVS